MTRTAHPLAANLRTFGHRLQMIALIPGIGRLYFDTWAAHEGRAVCYQLTGFGQSGEYTREAVARMLKGVPADQRFSAIGGTFDVLSGAR